MPLPSDLFEQHGVYLNTATYGWPPKATFDDVVAAMEDWRTGRTSEDAWEECTERARRTFARIVNVDPRDVAVGSAVSELLGLIAASLPDGARVLVAQNDFSSTLFPFAEHAARGVTVEDVPLAHLVRCVRDGVGIAAVSQVQAQSGEVADSGALAAAARQHGAMLCVDGTQSCGWLATDASDIDFYVTHAYKWLCAPRGAALLAVNRKRLESVVPLHAGWYATDDPNNNLFDLPPRLSANARRLDTSPAWFSWVGAARSLAILEEIGIANIEEHDMRLARRFADALDLEPPRSAIVYLDNARAAANFEGARIRASVRGGRLRVSFHLYNTEHDVERAVAAIRGVLT